jgi:hypothetical protein
MKVPEALVPAPMGVQAVPLTYCASLLNLRAFAEAGLGEGAFSAVRATLERRFGHRLPPVLAPHAWYPTLWLCRAMDVAAEMSSDAQFYERFGAFAAGRDVRMVFRFALRFTSPLWLMERGAKEWRRAHDTGHWDVEGRDGYLRGTLHDFGVVHVGQCRSLTAWFNRAARMTGVKRLVVAHSRCRALGGGTCVFEGEW